MAIDKVGSSALCDVTEETYNSVASCCLHTLTKSSLLPCFWHLSNTWKVRQHISISRKIKPFGFLPAGSCKQRAKCPAFWRSMASFLQVLADPLEWIRVRFQNKYNMSLLDDGQTGVWWRNSLRVTSHLSLIISERYEGELISWVGQNRSSNEKKQQSHCVTRNKSCFFFIIFPNDK